MLNKNSYSAASLSQRMAVIFSGPDWSYLPTHSDLCLAEGKVEGRKVLVVATDPATVLGTFGICECDDFQWALQRARATGVPLLLLMDSAGARLHAGLPIQGALRGLMRSVLDARLADLPILGVLGRYAFGAASILVGAANLRLHSANSLLAMSGPKVLQAALPEHSSRALINEQINGRARSQASSSDVLLADELEAYGEAIRTWVAAADGSTFSREALLQERRELAQRLKALASSRLLATASVTPLSLQHTGDQLACRLRRGFGAADALMLAEALEAAAATTQDRPLTILIDCPGHSVRLADEELLLTQYLVHLAVTLRRLTRGGADIRLLIENEISGGIYIALAAGATLTELADGAIVRTLPGAALLQILGADTLETSDGAAHLEWGVVDRLVIPHMDPDYAEKLTLV